MKMKAVQILLTLIVLGALTFTLLSCRSSADRPHTDTSTGTSHTESNEGTNRPNNPPSNESSPNTSPSISNDKLDVLFSFETTNGGYVITEYKGSKRNVDIPAQYKGKAIVEIGANAFSGKSISSVTLPNTIVSIGDKAFANTDITKITLPESLSHIGHYAFAQSKLTSVTIPKNVCYIGENAFYNCSSLESVKYNAIYCEPGWIQFSSHSSAMGDCITDAKPIFYQCPKLTTVEIGSEVKAIPPFLFSMTNIKQVSIPKNIEALGYGAFYKCDNLNTLYYNAPNATPIYNHDGAITIFNDDLRLFSVFDTTALTNIEFGPDVQSINDRLFMNCTSLTSITFPDNIKHIESNALQGCTELKELIVGTGVKEVSGTYKYGQGNMLLGAPYILKAELKGIETLTSSTISENTTIETLILGNIKYIEEHAFRGCKGLSTLSISDTILSIDGGISDDCKLLEYNSYENGMYIGNEDNPYAYLVSMINPSSDFTFHPNTKCIGYGVFEECTDLTSISLPEHLISIDAHAFSKCSSLTELSIPDTVQHIGYAAFNRCSSLTEITLPSKIIKIEDNTFNQTAITSIHIPSGVITIGDAFNHCSNLTSIVIPETVTFIDKNAFEGVALQRVDISSIPAWCHLKECGIIYGNYYSQQYDLYLNGELVTELDIPEGVRRIGDSVFEGIKNITKVSIPSSVTFIDRAAFRGCEFLDTIIYNGTKRDWNNIEFDDDSWNAWNEKTGEYIIYCTDGKIAK